MTQAATTVRAVVLDIGNVLIRWNPEGFYDRTLGPARRQALFDAVDLHAMNVAIDAGAPFRQTVMECAAAYPDWAAEIRMWHDNWIDMASPRIESSIVLMRLLRAKGVPVFALTNFGKDSFAYACTQYDFFNEFDRAFVSGELQVSKPEPAIYQHLETASGLSGDQLLFTDDRPENTAAAQARGWKAHLFTEPHGWAQRLVAEGLLTATEAKV